MPAQPGTAPAREGLSGAAAVRDVLASRLSGALGTAAALSIVLALAALLRLWQLDAVGYNSDEAVYAGQGASIAGDEELLPYFPVFRAHPLLFQTAVSLVFHVLGGVDDLAARLLTVTVGLATVLLAFLLGRLLYGTPVGIVTALFVALMPYHVVVTRQVLLDPAMTLFATLTVYLLARHALSGSPAWLYAGGGALGLAFLSKETSVLFLGSIFAYFALAPQVRVKVSQLLIAAAGFLLVCVPYPLSLMFSGKESTGQSFLAWQLFRRPNHPWTFYFTEVPFALGLGVVLLAVAGLVWLRPLADWRETLLLAWILVPTAFFTLWSVKGFQYLLPTAVPCAILAARAAILLPGRLAGSPAGRRAGVSTWATPVVVAVVAVSLLVPSWRQIQPSTTGALLAGSGGLPGGREAGLWVADNVPEGARLLTLGPSMANILQFYGHRKAYGLSVSPNPLNRNPTYEPIKNPDVWIRTNEIQYVVWDSYSASRSEFFSQRLLRYADRYNGRVVHTQAVTVRTPEGHDVQKPVIVVYEVRP